MGYVCPILFAGLIAHENDCDSIMELAKCLGKSCAWWNPKYNLCFIEMIALR